MGTRRAILSAAAEFATHGFDEVRVVRIADAVRRYVHWVHEDPRWVHTLAREEADTRPPAEDERAAELFKHVEELRERQARGEFRSDLDVRAVALAFFAASIAPVAIPWIARELGQQDPASTEFIDHYADQVGRIISALAGATQDDGWR